jgi:hypothetical protein
MEARPALSPPARRVARIPLWKSSGYFNKPWIEEGKLLGNGQDCPKVKVAAEYAPGRNDRIKLPPNAFASNLPSRASDPSKTRAPSP